MQSTRHDPSHPASHASSLPGYVLDVVVLTADGGLLATLRDASSPEHAIWHAPTADAAVDLLVGGRCGILIADLGTLRGEAAALLDRLHAQFPELVLMATGRRDEEFTVAALVSDGRIYRFLHKPISPARASLFISAATRRYFELRNTQPIALSTVKTIASRRHVGTFAAIFVVLALAAGGASWYFARQPGADAAAREAASSAQAARNRIADLLGRAQIAYLADRLAEPKGDNAIDYYREVLAIAPDHPDALAGLERVAAKLEERVLAALETRNPPAGADALSALQRAQPNHPRLAELQRELVAIARSMTAAPPPRATAPARTVPVEPPAAAESAAAMEPQPEPASVPDEETASTLAESEGLDAPTQDDIVEPAPVATAETPASDAAYEDAMELLALAIRRRERGMLLSPPGDNAFEYMQSLVTQYPEIDAVRFEQRQLATTLLDRARTALVARDLDDAAMYLDRAEQLMPGLTTAENLRRQLRSVREERERQAIAPAGSLKRLREVPPEYPREARLRGIEGWVDIEFTVDPEGVPQDLVVRAAHPERIFDKSALDALKRWRFEPVLRNGKPVAQRALLRMKYELEK